MDENEMIENTNLKLWLAASVAAGIATNIAVRKIGNMWLDRKFRKEAEKIDIKVSN